MQDLEGQVIQEESRSQANFLSACQVVLYNSSLELKSAFWILPTTSYWGKHLHVTSTHPSMQRTSPCGRTANYVCSLLSHWCPNSLIGQKDEHPSPDPVESMPTWWNHFRRLLWEDPPAPRGERPLTGSRTLKPSHANVHLAKTLTW